MTLDPASSSLRVCILTTAFPRWKDDPRGPFIYEAARALQRQGCHVSIISIHSPGAKTRENWDGIEIIRPRYLPERWEILQKEEGGLPVVWEKYPFARAAILPFVLVQAVTIALNARRFDLLHANWTLSAALAWVGRFIHQRPIIVTVQGSDIFKAAQKKWAGSITRLVLNRLQGVIALSQSLSEATYKLGIPKQKITIIPNGVDIRRFQPGSQQRAKMILFTGSLIERKGPRYLIEAFRQVCAVHQDAQLVLVGDGPQRRELEQQVLEAGLSHSVIFTGNQTQAQVQGWMQQARLFVLPSIEEGLGVVLLEALASGTPCIGSRVGGIPDVISPEVGRLVPAGDPEALACAILEFLNGDSLWEQASRDARLRAEQVYSWDLIAQRLLSVYQQALRK